MGVTIKILNYTLLEVKGKSSSQNYLKVINMVQDIVSHLTLQHYCTAGL